MNIINVVIKLALINGKKRMNLKTYFYRKTHKTQQKILRITLKIKDLSIKTNQ